jgi:hypothetical protein
MDDPKFSDLVGKTLDSIFGRRGDEEMVLLTTDGDRFIMFHDQDCCETVRIESIDGDAADLIGSPILLAEEVSHSDETPEGTPPPEYPDDSYTWTFYKLATIKGSVTIRWFGSSNGYYSESVTFARAA